MKTRTEHLMRAIGWKGGTIHQLSDELGIPSKAILSGVPSNGTYLGGEYFMGTCWNTNSMEHKINVLLPHHKGSVDFWLGVARCMEIDDQGENHE